jgi:hypothetical protein
LIIPPKRSNTFKQLPVRLELAWDIHVGDTIIGIKGRVGFEAAAPMVIIKAHHALEKHVLTKWQLNWKDQLAQFLWQLVYTKDKSWILLCVI